jgi:hypothetical protein
MKLQKIFVIRVKAKEDCFIKRNISGDPGRTLKLEDATVFSKLRAERVLHDLKLEYPNREFKIENLVSALAGNGA